MISLFAGEERDAKRQSLRDPLVVLARHAGEVLSRDQILQRLRGIEFNGTDRSVDVAISKLRRKFDDCAGEARKIKTVWGKGYLFSRSEWEC